MKSLIINADGNVYERDLGADTESIATAMSAYDPDTTWSPSR